MQVIIKRPDNAVTLLLLASGADVAAEVAKWVAQNGSGEYVGHFVVEGSLPDLAFYPSWECVSGNTVTVNLTKARAQFANEVALNKNAYFEDNKARMLNALITESTSVINDFKAVSEDFDALKTAVEAVNVGGTYATVISQLQSKVAIGYVAMLFPDNSFVVGPYAPVGTISSTDLLAVFTALAAGRSYSQAMLVSQEHLEAFYANPYKGFADDLIDGDGFFSP